MVEELFVSYETDKKLKEKRERLMANNIKAIYRVKLPDDKVFCANSNYCDRKSLKKRLIDNKILEYKCEECKISDTYNGKPISLQLDHKNNDGNVERKSLPPDIRGGKFFQLVLRQEKREDLQLLCANCHNAKRYGGCTEEDHEKMCNTKN